MTTREQKLRQLIEGWRFEHCLHDHDAYSDCADELAAILSDEVEVSDEDVEQAMRASGDAIGGDYAGMRAAPQADRQRVCGLGFGNMHITKEWLQRKLEHSDDSNCEAGVLHSPSCLTCGNVSNVAIFNAERPDIYVCTECQALLAQCSQVREGFVLVPVEPTEAMCRHVRDRMGTSANVAHNVYMYMLAAATDAEAEVKP